MPQNQNLIGTTTVRTPVSDVIPLLDDSRPAVGVRIAPALYALPGHAIAVDVREALRTAGVPVSLRGGADGQNLEAWANVIALKLQSMIETLYAPDHNDEVVGTVTVSRVGGA